MIATRVPLTEKHVRRNLVRITSWRSATASKSYSISELYSLARPRIPLYASKFTPRTTTFDGSHSYMPAKRSRVSIVILNCGFCLAKALSTGTVMATSPMALNLMTSSRLISFFSSFPNISRCVLSLNNHFILPLLGYVIANIMIISLLQHLIHDKFSHMCSSHAS